MTHKGHVFICWRQSALIFKFVFFIDWLLRGEMLEENLFYDIEILIFKTSFYC